LNLILKEMIKMLEEMRKYKEEEEERKKVNL
jgi:hypothetical protein